MLRPRWTPAYAGQAAHRRANRSSPEHVRAKRAPICAPTSEAVKLGWPRWFGFEAVKGALVLQPLSDPLTAPIPGRSPGARRRRYSAGSPSLRYSASVTRAPQWGAPSVMERWVMN
jgi:hypothetical protein